MKITELHVSKKVLQAVLTGMLCTLCCTAFFGCGKKTQPQLILADTEYSSDSGSGGTEESPDDSESPEESSEMSVSETESPSDTEALSAAGQEELVVYICGEVKNPGVYTLTGGARICDAVDAAGGMTPEAAEDYWNLAEKLSDGDMIYIPTKEEAEARDDSAADLSMNRSGGGDTAASSGQADTATATASGDSRININTASAAELTQIPGVGTVKAAAIIAYREANGDFSSIDEIKSVSGIGDGTFEKMKDSIRTE